MQKKCSKCSEVFSYAERECWWDYKGSDYDAKLVKHEECGCINVIKYVGMPNREKWELNLKKKEI